MKMKAKDDLSGVWRNADANDTMRHPEECDLSGGATDTPKISGGVDFIGLALDLDEREKTVESQTTKRAMIAAAHGLRLMGIEIRRLREKLKSLTP